MTTDGPQSLHDRTAELLEAYVLGALDPPEEAVVDEHLEDGCEDCEESVSALRRIASAIPLAAPLFRTSAALKSRVLANAYARPSAQAAAPPGRARGRGLLFLRGAPGPWFRTAAAAAAVLAVAGLLAWNVVLQSDVDSLESDRAGAIGRVAGVEANVAAAVTSLSAPNTQTVLFNGTPAAPAAEGRLLFAPDDGSYFMVVRGLAPTEPGAAYVIWAETPAGPERVGEFVVDERGETVTHGYLRTSLLDTISLKVLTRRTSLQPRPSATW